MISTLEEVSSKNNSKAEVCRKLPITLGHMELFKVIDYTKRYVAGIDLGYAVYYDLKNNRKGSGNIYVYTRDFGRKEEGLDEKALDELLVEQRDLTRNKAEGGKEEIVEYNGLKFYKVNFVTFPDSKNNQYDCLGFIRGHQGVFVKILFYYSLGSPYEAEETDLFMDALTRAMK